MQGFHSADGAGRFGGFFIRPPLHREYCELSQFSSLRPCASRLSASATASPERLCALPLARYAIFPLSSIIAPSFLPRFDVRAAELQCPRLTGVSLQPRTRDTSGGRANLHSQPEISSGMSFSFLDLDPAASRPTNSCSFGGFGSGAYSSEADQAVIFFFLQGCKTRPQERQLPSPFVLCNTSPLSSQGHQAFAMASLI